MSSKGQRRRQRKLVQPLPLDALRNELRRQRAAPFSRVRSRIVNQYGIVHSGRLQFCSVGRDTYHPGSKGKVMYATFEDAEAARAELEQLPGARPMRAYACLDALVEHYHLATSHYRSA